MSLSAKLALIVSRMRIKFALSSILCLFFSGSPSAVSREISFAIINSFDSVFWRGFWSHVSKKVFKRIFPAVTNFNSTTSVIGIEGACFGKAPCFHGNPRRIFWRSLTSVFSVAMFCYCIAVKTATTFMFSLTKIGGSGNRLVATDAFAFPQLSAVIFNRG